MTQLARCSRIARQWTQKLNSVARLAIHREGQRQITRAADMLEFAAMASR